MGYSLDLLKQIAHGLAQQFGDSCEIVIHDVRHGIENTILYIENGHVTDRMEDIIKAAKDHDYQQNLFKEFGL